MNSVFQGPLTIRFFPADRTCPLQRLNRPPPNSACPGSATRTIYELSLRRPQPGKKRLGIAAVYSRAHGGVQRIILILHIQEIDRRRGCEREVSSVCDAARVSYLEQAGQGRRAGG